MDWGALFSGLAAFTKALAWPITTVIGLYWYKPTVSRLLDRVIRGKIGPAGAEVEALAPAQVAIDQPQKDFQEQVKEIGSVKALPPADDYLDELSRVTVEQLEGDFPDNLIAQKRWLARLLGVVISQRNHEQTHRMIFGSQLLLVYKLNASGGILPADQSHPLYEQAVINFPDLYRSFDYTIWLRFLYARGLIEDAEFRGQPAISLTKAGRSYLQYIIDNQLPERNVG